MSAIADFSGLRSEHHQSLLTLARQVLTFGVDRHERLAPDFSLYPDIMRQTGCCFVTLTQANKLRGCIGSLEPYQPLVQDVATHAYAAAFLDRRFAPLRRDELSLTTIEISVITPQEPIECQSETELLNQLQPHRHGLTIRDGHHHATFLPSVWEQLPEKNTFLDALRQKAGLPLGYWSRTLQAYRYQSLSFSE